jgi:hypothetical protein
MLIGGNFRPGRLWSLWEMLRFNAKAFYTVTMALQHTETMLEAIGKDRHEETANGGVIVVPISDPISIGVMRQRARELHGSLLTLGTHLTSKVAQRLIGKLDGDFFTYPEFIALTREIRSRLQDELEDVTLLSLEVRDRAYFEPAKPLFGAPFETMFASALFELDEAAKCLALSRPTAAVFHLMRLMEIGIRAVARCLGIADPTRAADRNWGNILREIKADLDAHSGAAPTKVWTVAGDKQFFDGAYGSLDAVRVAWRNPTMHVEKKYTADEAELVFSAVKGFMTNLASRCDENGEPKA